MEFAVIIFNNYQLSGQLNLLFHPFSLGSFMVRSDCCPFVLATRTLFLPVVSLQEFFFVCVHVHQSVSKSLPEVFNCFNLFNFAKVKERISNVMFVIFWRTLVNLQGNEALFSLAFKICNEVILKQKEQAIGKIGEDYDKFKTACQLRLIFIKVRFVFRRFSYF